MISKCEDCDYTITIADLMVMLSELDEFILKIWISGSEIPFKYSQDDDFKFLQESLKIVSDGFVDYIYYDTITMVRVYYGNRTKNMVIGFE